MIFISASVTVASNFNFLSPEPSPKNITTLVKVREAYLKGRWDTCFSLAQKQAKQASPIQDWYQEFALRCARGEYVETKKIDLVNRWWSTFHNKLPIDFILWAEIKSNWLGLLQLMEKDQVADISKWALWFSKNFDLSIEQGLWISRLIDKNRPNIASATKFYFEPNNEVSLFQLWQANPQWESGMEYLLNFPGGQFVDKVEQGLYVQLLKKPDLSTKKLVLPVKERLMRRAHRLGDYDLAHLMAQAILKTDPVHADALFVGARSYYFVGKYASAEELFKQLIQLYPKYGEAEDVVLRLGFSMMRQENWIAARDHWEKVLRSSPKPGMELMARYWLLIVAQKVDPQFLASKKYLDDKEALIQRFPYSYYALKLGGVRVESSPQNETVKASQEFVILPRDQKNWSIMAILAQAGWWDEAHKIYRSLALPQEPEFRGLLIDYFKKIEFTPVLSPIVNEWITGGRLLDRETLRSIYPKPYQDLIQKQASHYKLSPELIWSLIRQESIFLSQIESSAQAVGLMQMIPATAKEVATSLKYNLRDWSFEGRSARINIQMGTHYLQSLISQFDQNEQLALAAYNYGPTRLKTWLRARKDIFILDPLLKDLWIEELPAQETQFYVKAIERNRIIYQFFLDSGPNNK